MAPAPTAATPTPTPTAAAQPVASKAAPTATADVSNGNSNGKHSHAPSSTSFPSSEPPLIDLYSGSQASMAITDEALRNDIIGGLRGSETFTVPGNVDSPEDRKFAFRRTMPTTALYSEVGLQLYDRLVEAPEYYLWNAEIDILKRHASEIALRMFGHQTYAEGRTTASLGNGSKQQQQQQQKEEKQEQQQDGPKKIPPHQIPPSAKDASRERWGDNRVGLHNGGVNAEEGLDSKVPAKGPASLVELGAGSLRKTVHLISALKEVAAAEKRAETAADAAVQYYALDLDKQELIRTLEELYTQKASGVDKKGQAWTVFDGSVGVNGMWATYDQGLDFIGADGLAPKSSKTAANDHGGDGPVVEEGKRCLVWLGSSIGNFDRRGAAEFLARAAQSALRPGDTMLVSMDRRNKPEDVAHAYNDAAGLTRDFIIQGLHHADKILGGGVLDAGKFEYYDRYNANEGRHESYYRALVDQTIVVRGEETEPISIEAGELIHVESSYKYNEREALDIFDYAGLRVINRWTDSSERYDLWLVERPSFHFSSTRLLTGSRQDIGAGLSVAQANGIRGSWEFDSDAGAGSNSIREPVVHATWGLPSLRDWDDMWRAWDTVTLTMIPQNMLHEKPIDLRHICLFYIGHIPAFLDILLARNLNEPHTNDHYSAIFERGIDPHMDDESQCNPHSEVPKRPEEWPTLDELLKYKEKVVQRVKDLYKDVFAGDRKLDRRFARLMWLTLEHQALHLETLLYMLAQSPSTLPPRGFIAPDWNLLKREWEAADARQGGRAAREATLNFKADTVTLGHDDDDETDFQYHVSSPSEDTDDLNSQLGSPEFGWDNEAPSRKVRTGAFAITAAPISNGQYLEFLDATKKTEWPVSWVKGANGKPMVRTLYGPVDMDVASLWPCQTSAVDLGAYAAWKGGRLPTQAELQRFMDATAGPNCTDRPGTNVGFRNWHPVPSQLAHADHDGTTLPGHNGGVWEWTSSMLEEYDGYKQSALYPGYSSDFFDGKHNIVMGGSYVTTPSIAGRRSVVNWYQAPYPYVFAGARVVFDSATPTRARTLSPAAAQRPRSP